MNHVVSMGSEVYSMMSGPSIKAGLKRSWAFGTFGYNNIFIPVVQSVKCPLIQASEAHSCQVYGWLEVRVLCCVAEVETSEATLWNNIKLSIVQLNTPQVTRLAQQAEIW